MTNNLEYQDVRPEELKLPACPIPRPGERVGWFADSRFLEGWLIGHDIEGLAVINTQFDRPTSKDFDEIRLINPYDRLGPNWTDLPAGGRVVRPPDAVLDGFRALMNIRIPPGPRYLDLAQEIWSRGFEVFVVGGTVRDVIAGKHWNDVDFVTTMPLGRCRRFLRSMFRYDPTIQKERGFMRIGGTPASGDPFIDLKVFSDFLPGTPDAIFGVGFKQDLSHRDFAFNAVYFDPINEVLIDPTGWGILDSCSGTLRLICTNENHFQHAQIFIRFIKFCCRGFVPTDETLAAISLGYCPCISVMKRRVRLDYLKAQIINKVPSYSDRRDAVTSFQSEMEKLGWGDSWEQRFASLVEELLS